MPEEANPNGGGGVAVVMVPFLAHSHLNQLLQLSCLIVSSYPSIISVHYASSSIHVRQVKSRAHHHGFDPSHLTKVRFHELPMDRFESPPPDPDSPEKFPFHLQPSYTASLSLKEPFSDYLRRISGVFRRVVVVHDFLTSAVVRDAVGSISNAESYMFNPVSSFGMALFRLGQSGHSLKLECSKQPPPLDDCQPPDMWDFLALHDEASECRSGDLFNTVRSVESPFLEALSGREISEGRKIWSVGPMLPAIANRPGPARGDGCLRWLDGHEPGSVVYVSFGTTTSLSDDTIRELALGLELSGSKFLWVLRDADRGNMFDGRDVRRFELPPGFEERTEGVGIVVREWAPQLGILAHGSTGGFVSHCGWNSVLESLTMGVPLAAWPMHGDQPSNAYLVTEVLRAGIVARDWAHRREVVKASTIAEVVRRLMGSEEGRAVRERAKELSEVMRRATEEGGESKVEMDSFVAHITRD